MMGEIAERLQALEAEQAAGLKMLADLESRRMALTETLLRIEGAIQVLRELASALPREVEAHLFTPDGATSMAIATRRNGAAQHG